MALQFKDFRSTYSLQATDQLLILKYKGGLVENAKKALNLVLSERKISKSQLMKAKLIVRQELAFNKNEKLKFEKCMERQKTFIDVIKWFI